jgi:hypothetical protein
MTPPFDELSELWQSAASEGPDDPRALLGELQRRGKAFDRMIRRRDWRESAAGMLIAVGFLWAALRATAPLNRIGDFWLSAYGVWIIVYLRRHSRASRDPDPNQPLEEFRQELVERYDRQIRLLQRAKFWYILPLWVGLMFVALAFLVRTGSRGGFLVMTAAWALMAGVLWWANEMAGVRYVRKQKSQMLERLGDREGGME